jgi:hypothetical protein
VISTNFIASSRCSSRLVGSKTAKESRYRPQLQLRRGEDVEESSAQDSWRSFVGFLEAVVAFWRTASV